MVKTDLMRCGHKSFLRVFAVVLLGIFVCMRAGSTEAVRATVDNGAKDSTWGGTCPNGEPYRLRAYRKNVADIMQPFYDYAGPAGQGTVQVDTVPTVMAARVCIKTAEIINRDYLTRSW
jgi:hypothetical protein